MIFIIVFAIVLKHHTFRKEKNCYNIIKILVILYETLNVKEFLLSKFYYTNMFAIMFACKGSFLSFTSKKDLKDLKNINTKIAD